MTAGAAVCLPCGRRGILARSEVCRRASSHPRPGRELFGRHSETGDGELRGKKSLARPSGEGGLRRGNCGARWAGAGKRRTIVSTAPEPNCSGRKKSPAGGAGGGPDDRGARIERARTWGAISAPDNPTRRIVSVKRKGRRVAPTAGGTLRPLRDCPGMRSLREWIGRAIAKLRRRIARRRDLRRRGYE